jgi:3-hydroxymyristoyl/3-hydroxydecanoyl-(acyl carrier protein) dehydratase
MRIVIPEGSPFFAGHFPGHPILPGIAHLALVAKALGNPPLAEVRLLKLRKPVLPGDVLDLSLEETEDLMRFEIRRGEEAVSNGVIRIGEEEAEVVEAPPADALPMGLIPHALPALLVRTASLAVIPEDNPFVEAGRAPAFAGLEAGAQAAALLEALARSSGGPRIGYVVAIRNARFRTPWLPAGRPLPVTVTPAGSAPPLAIYEVSVGEVVTGLISTYIAPERT